MLLRNEHDSLPNCRSELQVPENADHDTIERRYRRLLHQLDPHSANSPRALAACQVHLRGPWSNTTAKPPSSAFLQPHIACSG